MGAASSWPTVVVNRAVPRRDYTAGPGLGALGSAACRQLLREGTCSLFERVRRHFEAVLGDHLPLVTGRPDRRLTYVVRISAKAVADADAPVRPPARRWRRLYRLSNPRSFAGPTRLIKTVVARLTRRFAKLRCACGLCGAVRPWTGAAGNFVTRWARET